jgi:hypothetical protein
MKKIIVTSGFIFFAVICQAQWFVGSGLDYRFKSEKDGDAYSSYKKTSSEFLITPMVGYQKNKFAFGGSAILRIDTEKQMFQGNSRRPIKRNLWCIQSFVRYTFAEFGKFSIFTNTKIHFGYGNTERFADKALIEGYFYGINVTPVFSYNLSKRINFEATLNFANLGWNTIRPAKTQFDPTSSKYRKTVTNFGIGANSGDVATISVISIGISYR